MDAGPDLSSIVERNRMEILDLVRRHRGRSIALFGSVARGGATLEVDVVSAGALLDRDAEIRNDAISLTHD